MRGENLAPSVRPLAHEQGRRVLANDQVEVGVIGHAVAFVGGPLDLGDAVFRVPAAAHVARHVGEQEIMVEGMPDRPFGEDEPGPDLADRRFGVDQVAEFCRSASWLIAGVSSIAYGRLGGGVRQENVLDTTTFAFRDAGSLSAPPSKSARRGLPSRRQA